MIVRSVAEAEAIGRIRELDDSAIEQVIRYIDSIDPNALDRQRMTAKSRRKLGALVGQGFWMSEDFDSPMEFIDESR